MEPEWKNNRDSLLFKLPQYEIVGEQQDHLYRHKATRLVFTRLAIALVLIALIPIGFTLQKARERHRGQFARVGTAKSNPFKNRVKLNVLDTSREQKLGGWFLPASAPSGWLFLVVEVEVSNQAKQTFQLTPFSMALQTSDGVTYTVDAAIHRKWGRLKPGPLDKGETRKGKLAFKIPRSKTPKRLVLRSMHGTVISTAL